MDDIVPATPSDDASLQDRLLALEAINPDMPEAAIRRAIRSDCTGPWLNRAIAVWRAGAYDAACLYFWNRAMADLRTKVMAYGKEHLEAIIHQEIKDETDLINVLDDKSLVDHCFELGILSEQAWFFLHKARDVRNHYSLAHQFDAQIDAIESLNIIKNCIKYVLANQVPIPGINLKNLLEKMKTEDISTYLPEFEATYREQASKIVNITLNRLFDDFVRKESNNVYISNIMLVVPILWSLADSSVKTRIGKAVAKLRAEADTATSVQALAFLKKVNGLKYIPESMRVALFIGAADALFETCQEINNFYNEPGVAKALRELGPEVPSSAVPSCTRAAALSYIGNQFGYAWGAVEHNEAMIRAWNSRNVAALMDALDNDLVIIGRLDSPGPAQRLKQILEVVKDVPRDNDADKKFRLYERLKVDELTEHFRNKYMSKLRQR